MRSRVAGRLVAVGWVAAVGCGGGPPVVPVIGVATLNGAPLRYAKLTLVPAPGAAADASPGFAYTNAGGRFRPHTLTGRPGLVAGTYRMAVEEPDAVESFPWEVDRDPALTAGGPAPPAGDPPPAFPPRPAPLPAAYADPATTPLQVDVRPGVGELVLELTSGG